MSAPTRPTPARDALRDALAEQDAERAERVGVERFEAARLPYYVDELRRRGYTVHDPGVQCPAPALAMPHVARLSDPMTSHEAAPALPTQRSLCYAILELFGWPDRVAGWTVDEIGRVLKARGASTLVAHGSRRRVSDLKRLGLIEAAILADGRPVTRPGDTGRPQSVYHATDAGKAHLAKLARRD